MTGNLKPGTKVRISASFDDFKVWQLGSKFSMGQDVYVVGAKGRYALIASRLDCLNINARTVPIRLLKELDDEQKFI